ncbi:RNA-directed DNA polymerase, eukaryota, reverse transcriptase zinc-binding domain protein [Tanacetum coccineum]
MNECSASKDDSLKTNFIKDLENKLGDKNEVVANKLNKCDPIVDGNGNHGQEVWIQKRGVVELMLKLKKNVGMTEKVPRPNFRHNPQQPKGGSNKQGPMNGKSTIQYEYQAKKKTDSTSSKTPKKQGLNEPTNDVKNGEKVPYYKKRKKQASKKGKAQNNGNENSDEELDDVFNDESSICEWECDEGNGWRIMVGLNSENVGVNIIHSAKQSMLYEIMTLLGNKKDYIEMEDITISGLFYTWTKNLFKAKSGNANGFLKKLDKIMGNGEFIDKFFQDYAIFLPYLISDHCQTILVIPNALHTRKRAFKFANFVADKAKFFTTISKHWSETYVGCNMFKTVKKLKSLERDLKKLTLKNGNIFENVKNLKDQLKEVQVKIDKNPDDKKLREKESKLLKDYVDALKDEEKLLYQKAKVKWLSVGDRNNAYFHKVLKSRSHKSMINQISNDMGNSYHREAVDEQFVTHFKKFLGEAVLVNGLDAINFLIKNKLTKEEACDMVRDIIDDEIKSAMFQINGNKSPGLDGGRGLRQGDPMSPYLFILVMEILSLIVQKKVEENKYFKYHFRCKNMKLTHVCFGDDLLMFCHRDIASFSVLKDAIEEFGVVSGLLPNYSKSIIIFGSMSMEEI